MKRAGWNASGLVWWGVAVVLLVAMNLSSPMRHVRVVKPVHAATTDLSDVWNVPAAFIPVVSDLTIWPPWLVFCAIAILIARIAVQSVHTTSVWFASALVFVLSCYAESSQAVVAVLLFLTVRHLATCSIARRPLRWAVGSALLIAVAVMTSIDFGFIVLVLVVSMIAELVIGIMSDDGVARGAWLAASALIILVIGTAVVHPAVAAVMARPLTAVGNTQTQQALSLLSPTWTDPACWPAIAFLIICLWLSRDSFATKGRAAGTAAVVSILPIMLLLGTMSRFCLWPALVAVSTGLAVQVRSHSSALPRRGAQLVAPALCLLIASFVLVWSGLPHGAPLWTGSVTQRLVDMRNWDIKGPAVLTDLTLADDWRVPTAPVGITLVCDDRWDVDRMALDSYSAAITDLLDGRREHYLRADGTTGGYAAAFRRWQPALIVVDSSHWRALRQLSLDPGWDVLAIDARQTVFGSAENPSTRLQARRAAELLSYLEWPNPRQQVAIDGILELGTAHDSRQIAAVLCAMRFPYAALRVLPVDDESFATAQLRRWAHLELALRCLRQTGRRSLIDQLRAQITRGQNRSSFWSSSFSRRLTRTNFAALDDAATELARTADFESKEVSESERTIRNALEHGEVADIASNLAALPSQELQEFYAAIAELQTKPARQVIARLEVTSALAALPERLREESLFYCGCLSLEIGQPQAAISYFVACREQNIRSEFEVLRELYLSRLGAVNASSVREQ